jgi:putative copper export protein
MLVLRFATVLAIAVWIGGLFALGAIAAPAIFEVVSLRHVPEGRTLSGAIFGEVLRRFDLVSYSCGALILATLAVRAVLGPRPRRFSLRAGITVLMLGASLYAGMALSNRIERVQQEIGPGIAPSSLPAGDPRRVEFGRLHGQSTLIQLVPLLGGLVLMLFELRD